MRAFLLSAAALALTATPSFAADVAMSHVEPVDCSITDGAAVTFTGDISAGSVDAAEDAVMAIDCNVEFDLTVPATVTLVPTVDTIEHDTADFDDRITVTVTNTTATNGLEESVPTAGTQANGNNGVYQAQVADLSLDLSAASENDLDLVAATYEGTLTVTITAGGA